MELMLIICIFIYAIVTPTPTGDGLITFDFLKGFFTFLLAALRETPGFTSFLFFSIAFISLEVVAFQVILLHYCISRVCSGGGIGLWIGINAAMGAVGTVLFVFVVLGLGQIEIGEGATIAAVVLTLCGIIVAIAAIGFYLYLKTQDSIKFKLNVE